MINFDLNTTEKNIVGSVNEIEENLVGEKYGGGTGEIFNNYAGNSAPSSYAHAEGTNNYANGFASHAEGMGNTASAIGSHIEGTYSYNIQDAIHTVGIGNEESNGRKNAHVIKKEDGAHYIIGIGGYEGKATDSAQSLQTVISDLEEIHTPVIESGDPTLWGKEEEGEVPGIITQEQYNTIKTRIENGLPVIIRVDYDGAYTSTFTSISASTTTTPGRYSFCYIDYNTTSNQYFLKWFKMESDLTCQVRTKIL